MKTSFPNTSMVAHLWANQSQDTAHHTNHGHKQLFFDGPNLYSYGSHYLVGRIMPDGVALLNADSNSKTTNGHRSEAWHAASHRRRFKVPRLTDLARYTFDYLESAESRATGVKTIRLYCADRALELQDGAGEYLLSLTGDKFAPRTMIKLRRDAQRAKENTTKEKTKATRREQLAYASKVSKLTKDEKQLVAGLANVMAGHGHKIKDEATKLYNAHRAAKAAKREKQAADVWRVLQLVRAEIKLREKQAARKQANHYLQSTISDLRNGLRKLQAANDAGKCVGSGLVRDLTVYSDRLIESPRAKRASANLALLSAGASEAYDPIHQAETAAHEAKQRAELQAWLDGVPSARAPYTYGSKTLLRAVGVHRDESGAITGGTLQTSQLAEVPLTHAIRAFRFLKLCHDRGETWQRNGHSLRVGHFTIDRVQSNGDFHAGCHFITWDEVERIAVALGVFNAAASDDVLQPSDAAA